MNVQPKLSRPADCTMPAPAHLAQEGHGPRLPGGPRGFVTWPVEFEVEPWRP
jgi:hypothetical protein